MAKISANNIQVGAITSDKLDASVASDLASANNANTVATIATSVAAAAFNSANTNAAILANSAPIISSIQIADSSYNVLDDTSANTTGGYVVITGSGFTNSSTVVFGSTAAPSVSYVSSTTLRAQTPALTAASYPVYVVNSNGGTAIKVNGLTTSSFPAWGTAATLANTAANVAFSVSLSANSDSSITYSNTTVLPTGTSLLSNGYFYGTVTIGVQTTYTFTVDARDAEYQDALRTFSMTVTVAPPVYLYSWGNNSGGQVGINDVVSRSSPTQIGSDQTWNQLAGGRSFSAGIKTDGTLWTWGQNNQGQLGTNDIANRSSPTQVGAATNWNLISLGNYCVFAIKSDNTLWSFGWGANGQLGTNDVVSRSSPTQVGALSTWSKINTGVFSTAAVSTSGALWTWGRGTNGILGQNSVTYRSSPTQVGASTNWSTVAVGNQYMIATKTDGTLWSWGQNSNGQLGLNNAGPGTGSYKSSPTQVGADTNWSLVSTGNYNVAAIKTTGTRWAWGRNNNGQLGLNDVVYRSSPTQVGGDTNWSSLVSSFGGVVLALKSTGTIWSNGLGTDGQHGLGDTLNRSSPTQIGTGTNWTKIGQGWNQGMAK